MADERIDVEVTDKVSANVEKKLREIGDAAGSAHTFVERLKAELGSMNTSALVKLQAASNSTTRALAAQMNAQARLATATARSAMEDAKAALQKQRLATETARTEAAQARAMQATATAASASLRATQAAQAAQDRANAVKEQATRAAREHTAALDREAAAQARIKAMVERSVASSGIRQAAPGALGGMAGSRATAAAQTEAMRSGLDQVTQATQRADAAGAAFETATVSRFGRIKAATLNAYDSTRDALHHWFSPRGAQQGAKGMDALASSTLKAGNASKLAGHHQANLVAQINDIGVSLASGQNPFIVMIQQGSQLQDLSMRVEGGFKTLAMATLRMFAPFAAVAAIVGVLAVEFRSFHKAIKDEAEPELKAFVDTLGLTRDELKRLEEDSGGITVTMGDMWKGFWATVKEGLAGFSDEWDSVTNFVGEAWDFTVDFLYKAFVGFYGLVVGGMRGIAKIIGNLPTVAAETAKAIANVTLSAIEFMTNKVIDGINFVVAGASEVLGFFGIEIEQMGHVSFGRFARTGADAADIIAAEVTGAVREADRTLTAFGQRWDANARTAARDRIGNAAQEILDDRSPGRAARNRRDGQEAKTQIDYINETTNALDNELARMRMLKDEREVQQRLDQIEQEFIRRRMPLDQAQLAVFREKIEAITEYKYVQSELDRITEEVQAPMRTYNAVQSAANDLLARGVINAEQYAEQITRAGRAMAQATDPLFNFKEELAAGERALGLYGDAIEANNYLETVRQALVEQGYEGDALRVKMLSEEVQGLIARNAALREQQAIQSTVASIVDPLLERQNMLANESNYYAELQRLRDNDVLSTQQYEQAKYELQARFSEMRLQGASTFFGQLASLTSSGNKELAAIGKAAAVAQATIDGYVAVQKALASAPPPWNFALAGAVALQTGVQVAGIMSTNVGNFATGGDFMVQGKAGIDNNNINMNVSRGERVTIQTPAQQREAMNNGGGQPVEVKQKIVNMFDEREFISAMDSEDGEEVIMNIIRRRKSDTAGILGLG